MITLRFGQSTHQIIPPLFVLGSFAAGLYFRGTDNLLVLPHIGALLLLAGLSLWPCFQKGWHLPRGGFAALLFAYALYIWASVFWSTVPYNSTLFALIFSVLPLTVFTLLLAPEPLKNLRLCMGALGIGIAVLALWALVQFFILTPGDRVHDPMLNPNNLAVIFNMGLFPALALYIHAHGDTKRDKHLSAAGFVLAALCFMALLATQSRGALLSFLIVAGPFFLFTWKHPGLTTRKFILFTLFAVAAFLLFNAVSAGSMGRNFTDVLLTGTDGEEAYSVAERKIIWKSSFDVVREHFWLGTGLGSFTYFYASHRSPRDFSDGYFAHMDPLQFWAEMGVLAPILFYAILMAVLMRTINATRRSETFSPERLWLYAFFCGLLALAGHAHISFHFYLPVNLFVAGFLLAGWFLASGRILGAEPRTVRLSGPYWKICFIALLLLPALWLSQSAAGIYFTGKIRTFLAESQLPEARAALDTARRLAPANYPPLYTSEAQYRIKLLTDKSSKLSPEVRKNLYEEAQTYIDRAIALNSGFATLRLRKAMIMLAGYPAFDPEGRDKAEALMVQALEMNPLSLETRIVLSRLYRAEKRPDKALKVLREALSWPLSKSVATLELYNELARLTLLETKDLAGYNALIKQRNEFAARNGVKILNPFPLTPEEVKTILEKR
ncbi:MAG: O-antigen ligase family protein [Alphaproteobacteria bacterium]|nr:O-antigen ligase family protein [Alphaproteobacteria bacterium]